MHRRISNGQVLIKSCHFFNIKSPVFPPLKMNIEHPTSNIQRRMWFASLLFSAFMSIQLVAESQQFNVQCSMFDVERSSV